MPGVHGLDMSVFENPLSKCGLIVRICGGKCCVCQQNAFCSAGKSWWMACWSQDCREQQQNSALFFTLCALSFFAFWPRMIPHETGHIHGLPPLWDTSFTQEMAPPEHRFTGQKNDIESLFKRLHSTTVRK